MPKTSRKRKLKPYWTTSDRESVKLYRGDVLRVLKQLPSQLVQCVVTSPPYWGLRDYKGESEQLGSEKSPDCLGWARGENCAEGNWEEGCHVCRMVLVFREARRVLRDDGTCWINYGDSYSNSKNLKSGNLTGVPWRVALALQTDGWILRQDIIWAKPSPMPEPVKNRCTKAHEYLFLLTKKGSRYYYDAEAIKEPLKDSPEVYMKKLGNKVNREGIKFQDAGAARKQGNFKEYVNRDSAYVPNGANKRSVWTIASEDYPGAHFATFPRKLIEPCIKAGTSEMGCCSECGTPCVRVVEIDTQSKTVGWEWGCDCEEGEAVPCVVLDPFIGSGTTCCVSLALGRNSIGIELSEDYLVNNAIVRIRGVITSRPNLRGLMPKKG